MLDRASVECAMQDVAAVIVSVHTISRQSSGAARGFMDVEETGLRNIAAACGAADVRRLLYVNSIGVAEHAPSSWLRGRWRVEQMLLNSGGLDVTVLRPGMIVGRGGDGFSIVARGATGRFALAVGSPQQRFRTIAVDDLAQDLVELIGEPRSFGQAFDVGSEDVLTMRQMMAVAAVSLGRRPARSVFIPAGVVRAVAPAVERLARMPKGAVGGFVGDGPGESMIGDPSEERSVLGRTDRSFRDSLVGELL